MSQGQDTNAAIWKSDAIVREWVASAEDRERARVATWRFMGELLPFGEDETFSFLDLGAGTGGASQASLELYPNSRALLADYSPQMMAAGTAAMQRFEGRFAYVEFDMLAGVWPDAIPHGLDAVVSSLCVHHLPDDRKQGLFSEVLDRLRPGAWYVNFDPVTTEDDLVGEAWSRVGEREDPGSTERALHRTPQEQARYENHVRYMIPLDRQVGYLRDAGFEAVEVYWKRLDYVVYGGRRPLSSTR
jgi:tRNA (cmo5U34)-methyltransferase